MQITYECQICKHITTERPPEWCPECGGHRVIFKRIVHSEEFALVS